MEFYSAVSLKSYEIAKDILLTKGFQNYEEFFYDENHNYEIKKNAFYLACETGQKDIIELLIKENINYTHYSNGFDETSLTITYKNGHYKLFQYLYSVNYLNENTILNLRPNYKPTIFKYFCSNGYSGYIKFIIQQFIKEDVDEDEDDEYDFFTIHKKKIKKFDIDSISECIYISENINLIKETYRVVGPQVYRGIIFEWFLFEAFSDDPDIEFLSKIINLPKKKEIILISLIEKYIEFSSPKMTDILKNFLKNTILNLYKLQPRPHSFQLKSLWLKITKNYPDLLM